MFMPSTNGDGVLQHARCRSTCKGPLQLQVFCLRHMHSGLPCGTHIPVCKFLAGILAAVGNSPWRPAGMMYDISAG